MRDPKRIKEFCEQLDLLSKSIKERCNMRCGDCEHFNACLEFWHSDYSSAETIEETALAYKNKDSCKHFRYTDLDASDVKAISDELDEIDHEIDELDEEITSIKAKMTIAKTKRGKPMSKECKAWFGRAGVALSIKKNQLRKLHIEKMHTERALKSAKAGIQKRRERIQNELFYAKLKELMSDSELKTFLAECQIKIEGETVGDSMKYEICKDCAYYEYHNEVEDGVEYKGYYCGGFEYLTDSARLENIEECEYADKD